jgi:RND family efflux transporter MFP subunit
MTTVQSSLTRRDAGDDAPFPALKRRAKVRSPRRGGLMHRLQFIEEERMTRRQMVVVVIVVVLVIVGGMSLWGYLRDSAETRAERAPAATANASEPVSVQVVMPERRELLRRTTLPAGVEAIEQATLYAKTTGYLKWIQVDIGDRVHQGEALAEIDVPEMVKEYDAAQAEVQRANANLANAHAEAARAKAEIELKQITYERLKGIREQEPDVLPQQEVDEAKAQYDVARAMVNVAESQIKVAESEVAKADAARARVAALMAYAKIYAPFSGVVIKRYVDPGALIQQASSQTNVSPVVSVARMDRLRIFIEVPERDVSFIKKGNPVTLTVDALPGRAFNGVCTRFATALDPKTRTMKTEIDIPNRDGLLRPGMYGQVNLTLERRDNVLTVPAGALIAEGGKISIYTVADGKAKRLEIETGLDDGVRVEITRGLTGKDAVIITGKNAVRDGRPVKIVQASF